MQSSINERTVSVLNFGAVGDGRTDDTQAIQAALDSGANHIVIPVGTYPISNVLKPHQGQCLQIDGTIRVMPAVIQPLTKDVAPGDDQVTVEDASAYYVGQWVTLYDEGLPIHLRDWVDEDSEDYAAMPPHGATYQTRRIFAGNARIIEIHDNTIKLDNQSARDYLCERNACLATQHSAILVEHSDVRICGTGTIDGNKSAQLDAQPCSLNVLSDEENRVGCCITIKAPRDLSNIIIEDITIKNAILHNITIGASNGAMYKGYFVSDSIIRNVRCVHSHDKNILIGRCRDCQIINNFIGYAEFEEGIEFHQVGDRDGAAFVGRISIQGNYIIGNARFGLDIGANIKNIYTSNNTIVSNGFNLGLGGDHCISTNDIVIGHNDAKFPLHKARPSVFIGGRHITVNNLTVLDSFGDGIGICGQDIIIHNSLIRNTAQSQTDEKAKGITLAYNAGAEKSLYPAVGVVPFIIQRQTEYVAEQVRITGTTVSGFAVGIDIQDNVRQVTLCENDFEHNESNHEIADKVRSNITLHNNTGLA